MPAPPPDPAWPAWHAAAATPAVDTQLRSLYADLDAAVAERGPTCWQSGNCCHFRDFGHRLYVTALEVAWFLKEAAPPPAPAGVRLPQLGKTTEGDCPWQVDEACTAHAVRPLGCRVFFCQHGTEAWQQDLYEAFLSRLKALHTKHDLPYRYLEWIAGLEEARRK